MAVNADTTVPVRRLLELTASTDADSGPIGAWPAAVTFTLPNSNQYASFWIQLQVPALGAGALAVEAKVGPRATSFEGVPTADHYYGGDLAAEGLTYFLPGHALPGGVRLNLGAMPNDATVYVLMTNSAHTTTHPGK